MSATIVRVEGEIIHYPAALQRLTEFLLSLEYPQILVVTAIREFSRQIDRELQHVLDTDYEPCFPESGFEMAGSSFRQLSKKLTDLLKGIHLTGDYSPALKDKVLSFGEQLSALLLTEKLNGPGLKVRVILPEEAGLQVTPDYGNATFQSLNHPDILKSTVYHVGVVPGSYGRTRQGKTARAGQSAADYTAAFLAEQLQARRLVLWNLSTEFTSADTRIIPEAEVLKRLTYAEASELAYFEHFDFHPRTVEPLLKGHIPIHIIRSDSASFEPDTIINSEDYVSERVVKSVACTDDISVLKLNGPGVGLKPGILAGITGILSDHSINIKSVITSQVSINILLDRKNGPKARQLAEKQGFASVSETELLEEVTLVAIVGHGMQDHFGISATLFSAIAGSHINVMLSGSGASDLVSYLIIRAADKQKCVRAVYDAFFQS
jgi:bifunctional aspartokinase / homoserine dehydrogenase 1